MANLFARSQWTINYKLWLMQMHILFVVRSFFKKMNDLKESVRIQNQLSVICQNYLSVWNIMLRSFKIYEYRHCNIKFTVEEEQDNKIYFLDISITRVGNKLQKSLFRKKTFSGVYLNFNSHLQNTYKKRFNWHLIISRL